MTAEFTLTPLTALDAVNKMLLSIGQGKVESLIANESIDAQNAEMILHNTSREVQERGWWFNRERDYPLFPDNDGVIALPANALEFSANPEFRYAVERGRQLYHTTNHTAVFEAGTLIKGTMTVFLAFEDLPQAARSYIANRAGREFQIGFASDVLYRFTREMEEIALGGMNRAHLRAERPNILRDNWSVSRIARGRR